MERKDIQKIVSEAMILEAEEAKKAGKIGYMARTLVQATLPHKATKEKVFTRRNGAYEMSIISPVGLPYGSVPRILMSWVTTEAVRTRCPELVLGSSLSSFMTELYLLRTGGQRGDITRLRTQAERLFSSSISCRYSSEERSHGKGFNIAKEYSLWWNPKTPNQLPIWKSTVTLGTDFFKEITEKPVPVDMLAIKALKRSPMALDIYFWLTYRMSYLQKDAVIPWPLLQMQFGADYSQTPEGLRDFKKNFLLRLKNVQSVYEKARVYDEENGLLLRPSPPHVAKKSIPSINSPLKNITSQSATEFLAEKLFGGEIDLQLRTETYEKAREIAPRLDIYHLEAVWREWVFDKGEMPKNPDKAFLGFVRKKVKQHSG